MIKIIVLLVELVLTVATFLLIFNMTMYATMSYQEAKNTAYRTINDFEQNTTSTYGNIPTGYMPAAANGILSDLINFRI
ncbi:hypothetical protein A3K64_00190 [Candidatus Micrarchaeota archaeon RBG_16_36_9]|nr:MAG: hypothetical protein A3K64_00190 [Candidatus Micrarchaeota archaeon RBG_16_36_9]